MNINSDYQDSEQSNVEKAEIAMDCLEVNVVGKALEKLEIIDIVGFATVKSFVQDLAEKADAYESIMNGKNSRN